MPSSPLDTSSFAPANYAARYLIYATSNQGTRRARCRKLPTTPDCARCDCLNGAFRCLEMFERTARLQTVGAPYCDRSGEGGGARMGLIRLGLHDGDQFEARKFCDSAR